MILNSITALFSVICFASFSHTLPIQDEDLLAQFLKNINHIKELDPAATIENEVLPSGVRHVQTFTSLTDTEDPDRETILIIKALENLPKSRKELSDSQMKEWYAYDKGSKSPLKNLEYVITKYPNGISGKTTSDNDIIKTFKSLSKAVVSSLKEKEEGEININIHLSFGKNGDKSVLDGPGNASVPTLSPEYSDTTDINADTTETINKISEPSVETPPDICQDASLDTIERTQDGSTYAFKGDFYWKINYNVTAPGYPRKISDDWVGMEGNLDASFTWPGGKTYFFKGERCWRFTNKEMDPGYPQLISEVFKGIPDNLDAALVWGGNGKPYFFKGKEYWRYDVNSEPPVKNEYPAQITAWKGLPEDGVNAAILWDNNKSYFFKGGQYYRFDDATEEVSKFLPYPCSTALYWFSCKDYSC